MFYTLNLVSIWNDENEGEVSYGGSLPASSPTWLICALDVCSGYRDGEILLTKTSRIG